MKWKEFLDPKWKKIGLAIILRLLVSFVLIVHYFFLSYGSIEYTITHGLMGITPFFIDIPLLIVLVILFLYFKIEKLSKLIITIFLLFILDLSFWFWVSCLIFLVYDKVKKK